MIQQDNPPGTHGSADADLAREAGLLWSRRERRRLARCGAAPGRRFAGRVPAAKPRGGFTRDDIELRALLAAPGLRRRDVAVRTTRPGRVEVELRGPRATARSAVAVAAALDRVVPTGVGLAVVLGSEEL